jgi:hypothetical protein
MPAGHRHRPALPIAAVRLRARLRVPEELPVEAVGVRLERVVDGRRRRRRVEQQRVAKEQRQLLPRHIWVDPTCEAEVPQTRVQHQRAVTDGDDGRPQRDEGGRAQLDTGVSPMAEVASRRGAKNDCMRTFR